MKLVRKAGRKVAPIEDFVVKEKGDRVLKTFKTQAQAITWAKSEGHSPHVARVRHLNDKEKPDQWPPGLTFAPHLVGRFILSQPNIDGVA